MPSLADLSPDSFDFVARYVLAGFLIFLIRNAYVFGERPKLSEIAFDVLLFSMVNQIVWRFVVYMGDLAVEVSTTPERLLQFRPGPEALFFMEVLILPMAIGLASGIALRIGWTKGALRSISLPTFGAIPRAYDHVFSERGPGYVILSFQDGTIVHGYYGDQSRAGRDAGRSGIYLESLYDVNDAGQWTEAQPKRAALISLGGLRAIEFLN